MTTCPACGHCRVQREGDTLRCLHCGRVDHIVAAIEFAEGVKLDARLFGGLLRIYARMFPGSCMEVDKIPGGTMYIVKGAQ